MMYHAYSAYQPKDPETRRRMDLAASTWREQPWTEIPIGDHAVRCLRDEKGKMPFVSDILNLACKDKKNEDIIVFTNSDICVSRDCSYKIAMALTSIDAAYCFRRDFGRLSKPVPDSQIHKGYLYCGSDLYAFRVGWWRKFGREFPDMLLGREGWDAVLRILIELSHPDQNPTLYDLIYHEKHGSVWENPHNRRTIQGQLHNVRAGRHFCYTFGFDPRRIGL